MRIMPTSGILRADDTKPRPRAGATKRGRDHGKTVESKQTSIEVAFAECDSFGAENEGRQDACVETEKIIELAEGSTERPEDVAIPDDSGRSIESARVQEHQENRWETPETGRLRGNRRKSGDRKQRCGDRGEVEDDKRGSSWWRDGGQTILQFFGRILGKRGEMGAKGATDRVSPGGNKRQRVKRVSRGDRSHNGRAEAGARLKKVSNVHIATHAYRNESQRRSTAKNKSRWQRKEPHPSILLRQIQRTRDKNLRVALLEQELRSRLPLVRNVARADRALRLEQFSSPLC